MRNTIHLHGAMKKRFAPSYTLVCSTPAEAIRALVMMVPGMREAIEAGAWRVVRGPLKGGRSLTVQDIGVNLPGEMHLVAAAAGAKGTGVSAGKIIVGAALIAAAFIFAPVAAAGASSLFGAAMGGTAFTVLGTTISYGAIASVGAMLLVGGVSQLLSPTPKGTQGAGTVDTKPSYLFNGALNQGDDGAAVPIGFGTMRIPGIVISQGIDVVDIPT